MQLPGCHYLLPRLPMLPHRSEPHLLRERRLLRSRHFVLRQRVLPNGWELYLLRERRVLRFWHVLLRGRVLPGRLVLLRLERCSGLFVHTVRLSRSGRDQGGPSSSSARRPALSRLVRRPSAHATGNAACSRRASASGGVRG